MSVMDLFGKREDWQRKYGKRAQKAILAGRQEIETSFKDILGKSLFEQGQALQSNRKGMDAAVGEARGAAAGARQDAATSLKQGLGQAKGQMANTGGSFGGSANVGLQRAYLSDYGRRLTSIQSVLGGQTAQLRAQQSQTETGLLASSPRTQAASGRLSALMKSYQDEAALNTSMRQEGPAPNAKAEMLQLAFDLYGGFA